MYDQLCPWHAGQGDNPLTTPPAVSNAQAVHCEGVGVHLTDPEVWRGCAV